MLIFLYSKSSLFYITWQLYYIVTLIFKRILLHVTPPESKRMSLILLRQTFEMFLRALPFTSFAMLVSPSLELLSYSGSIYNQAPSSSTSNPIINMTLSSPLPGNVFHPAFR